jgi:hypothetical protein
MVFTIHCEKSCWVSKQVFDCPIGQVKIWPSFWRKITFFCNFWLLFDCWQEGSLLFNLLFDLFYLWASGCSFRLLSWRQKSHYTYKKFPKLAWKLVLIFSSVPLHEWWEIMRERTSWLQEHRMMESPLV